MTDQQHPITPSNELVLQWEGEYWSKINGLLGSDAGCQRYIATQSARWGYEQRGADNKEKLQKVRDEELEACVEWLSTQEYWVTADALRAARRPKPTSEADQALKSVAAIENMSDQYVQFGQDIGIIRSALKRLQELEARDD